MADTSKDEHLYKADTSTTRTILYDGHFYKADMSTKRTPHRAVTSTRRTLYKADIST